MTPAEAKNLRPMKGQPVKIEWRRPEDDWPYFHLLEVSPKDSALKLRGMDYPDCSAKHDGGVFWVDWVDVVRIVPLSANDKLSGGKNRRIQFAKQMRRLEPSSERSERA